MLRSKRKIICFYSKTIIKKLSDEVNVKFFEEEEYLEGKRIQVKAVSYQSIFDLAEKIDKLVASGVFKEMKLG